MKLKTSKFIVADLSQEDLDYTMKIAKDNIPATLLMIMHNQAVINEKLDKILNKKGKNGQ